MKPKKKSPQYKPTYCLYNLIDLTYIQPLLYINSHTMNMFIHYLYTSCKRGSDHKQKKHVTKSTNLAFNTLVEKLCFHSPSGCDCFHLQYVLTASIQQICAGEVPLKFNLSEALQF